MKKLLFTLIVLILSTIGYAQDACYTIYMEALQEYNKGHYVEAQRKFVIVAQTCGDYSDIWNKLKSCNKILADKQSQQANLVTNLKTEKQQLEAAKKKTETTHLNEMHNAAVQIKNAETLIRYKSDTIQMQRRWNLVWRDSVMKVNKRLDSLQLELDSVHAQVISLQAEINERTARDRNNRKNDKKLPKPEEQIVLLAQDTLNNDSINIIK